MFSSSSTALLESYLNNSAACDDPFGLRKKSINRAMGGPVAEAPIPVIPQEFLPVDSSLPAPLDDAPIKPAAEQTDKENTANSPVKTAVKAARPFLKASKPSSIKSLAMETPRHEPSVSAPTTGRHERKASKAAATAIVLEAVTFQEAEYYGDILSGSLSAGPWSTMGFPAFMGSLRESAWAPLVAAIGKIRDFLVTLPSESMATYEAEAVLSLLHLGPSFHPANLSVLRAVYECAAVCVCASAAIGPAMANFIMSEAMPKGVDKKTRDIIKPCLLALTAAAGPRVIGQSLAGLLACKENKNFKSIEFALDFLTEAVAAFGLTLFDYSVLFQTAKRQLEQPNKAIRESAIHLLVGLYKQTGPLMKSFINRELKEAHVKSVEEEIAQLSPPVSAELVVPSHSPSLSARGPHSLAVALDADTLFPRVELGEALGEEFHAKGAAPEWKIRNEYFDGLSSALQRLGGRLACRDVRVYDAIQYGLADKNKNIALKSLQVLRALMAAVGPNNPVKYLTKIFPNLFVTLSDSKAAIRVESMQAIECAIEYYGVNCVMKYIPGALENAQGKPELIQCLANTIAVNEGQECAQPAAPTTLELLDLLLTQLLDKNQEVRQATERFVGRALRGKGANEAIQDKIRSMKRADQLAILGAVQNIASRPLDQLANTTATQAAQDKPVSSSSSSAAPAARPAKDAAAPVDATASAPSAPTTAKKAPSAFVRKQSKPFAGDKERDEASSAASAAPVSLFLTDYCLSVKRFKASSNRLAPLFRSPFSTDEEAAAFRADCANYFHSSQVALMFHSDYASKIQAIDMLEKELAGQAPASNGAAAQSGPAKEVLIGALEPLLRWLSACLFEANPKFHHRLVSFLSSLFERLDHYQVKFSDSEASAIFPALIDSGLSHSIGQTRLSCRALLMAGRSLYSAPKFFTFLLAALDGKNKRLVQEAAEFTWTLIAAKAQFSPVETRKFINVFAPLLSAFPHEPALKATVFSVLGHLHQAAPERFWSALGECERLNGQAKLVEMIEEKMKRQEKIEENKQREKEKEKEAEVAPVADAPVGAVDGTNGGNGFQLISMLSVFASPAPSAVRLRSIDDIANLLSAAGPRSFLPLMNQLLQILMSEMSASLFQAGPDGTELVQVDWQANALIMGLLKQLFAHKSLLERIEGPLMQEIVFYYYTLIHESRLQPYEAIKERLVEQANYLIGAIDEKRALDTLAGSLGKAMEISALDSPLVGQLASLYRQRVEALAGADQLDNEQIAALFSQLDSLATAHSRAASVERSSDLVRRTVLDCANVLACVAGQGVEVPMAIQKMDEKEHQKRMSMQAGQGATQAEAQNTQEAEAAPVAEPVAKAAEPEVQESSDAPVSTASAEPTESAVDVNAMKSRRLTGALSRQLFASLSLEQEADEAAEAVDQQDSGSEQVMIIQETRRPSVIAAAAPNITMPAPSSTYSLAAKPAPSMAVVGNIYQAQFEEMKRRAIAMENKQTTQDQEQGQDKEQDSMPVVADVPVSIPVSAPTVDTDAPATSGGLASLKARLAALNARKMR